ncbi:MAG: hypothetical protein HQK56_07185 [Deltaproteobacteria bacterium]|nr:hypothetical protein [Deltaproteobacteria bacterium]
MSLAESTLESLAQVDGLPENKAETLLQSARDYLATKGQGPSQPAGPEESTSPIETAEAPPVPETPAENALAPAADGPKDDQVGDEEDSESNESDEAADEPDPDDAGPEPDESSKASE